LETMEAKLPQTLEPMEVALVAELPCPLASPFGLTVT
jgi:hypothetical protein